MGKTRYQTLWEKVFGDVYFAHCSVCLKSFKIDNQGIGQVKNHAKSHEKNGEKKEAMKYFERKIGI